MGKQFKVGQRWRRRDGIVVVISHVGDRDSPTRTSDGMYHDPDGCILGSRDQSDLVELIEDVPPAEPEPKPLFHVGQEGVTTRDGRDVQILCVNTPGQQPICAVLEDKYACGLWRPELFSADGSFHEDGSKHNNDLIPPPPPKQYAYVNIFSSVIDGTLGIGLVFPTRQEADKQPGLRVGCIRVELAERWDD